MDKPYKHLFCEEPFTNLELSDNGNIYNCCPSWLPRPLGNLQKDSFDDAWNSKAAQEIRASIHDGSYKYCDKNLCPRLKGEEMPRSEITDENLIELMDTEKVVLEKPASRLNLCYDRSCNLQCPSCRSTLIYHRPESEEWYKAKKIQDQVVKKLADIEWLKLTGSGDPFASPLFFELLKKVDSDRYPKLKIFLHTNGLLFTPERWSEMASAQNSISKVEVSIDAATESTYAKLRFPGDFKLLLRNLEFISDLYKNGPIKDLKLSFVVQSENFREIPDFIHLGQRFGVSRVYFALLDDWGTFSHEEYKKRAVHLEAHPLHGELCKILAKLDHDPKFADFGNLLHLFPNKM